MARLDVHAIRTGVGPACVLDVQARLLDLLETRTVVPLVVEAGAPAAMGRLNPVFEVDGSRHVMLTQAIASVPVRELGPAVTSLDKHHDEVNLALDFLLNGF